MAEIGKQNKLKVVKEVEFGIYLDGGIHGEILMPKRYVPQDCKPEDIIEAFVYLDSEDRIIATTEKPYAMVDEFALLTVVAVNSTGAFLDWGLMKDLLVPFSEQSVKMEEGKSYMVYIYLDHESRRIVASAKLDQFLDIKPHTFEGGEAVDLTICSKTEIGYKAIIDNTWWGILYGNEVFQPLNKGQHIKGYIKKVREDDKLDLSLFKPHYAKVDDIAAIVLERLQEQNGFLPVTDKSSPDAIYTIFGVSKKAYKIAVGKLYKAKLITLEKNGIRLIKPKPSPAP
ncbi:MAG: S1-like domain-containing RNA-binding protein [Bacteroidota bacterium]|nr:S1-like domain-containing RNA-binding protein [Bacteroidota bacterium]